MGRIIAVEYVTLDGIFEEPGWSGPYFGGELQAFQFNNLLEADALLLGRVTYEGFAQAWPSMAAETGEFGNKMNTMPKWVATSSPDDLTWNATALEGDILEAVRALAADPGSGSLLINGSAQLFNALAAESLIDEIRLMVFPVIVGEGKRLWEGGRPPLSLALREARTTDTGVLIATYVPAAAAPTAD